jgi:hypothetical protein
LRKGTAGARVAREKLSAIVSTVEPVDQAGLLTVNGGDFATALAASWEAFV